MLSAAMVLAAGRGERMRPLSDVLPKPALPMVDEPVVASALRLAAAASTRPPVVNTWHLAEAMEAALASVDLGREIVVSREPELMGTAGGIALARDRGLIDTGGPLLVVNGDGLLDLDLDPLLERMASSDDLVSLALLPHPDPTRWSRVALDRAGSVTSIASPGPPVPGEAPLVYPGVMLIAGDAVGELAPGPGDTPERLWRPALEAGRLGGAIVRGRWREVGTPIDYLEAALDRLDGGAVVDTTAEIHDDAVIASAIVGRAVRIGAGAVVDGSVVADGAVIGRDARVRPSVLLGMVEIGAAEVVLDEFRARPHRSGPPATPSPPSPGATTTG